ncbi:MAG: ABC transporter permease subunit [Vibrionaceae bacterium]
MLFNDDDVYQEQSNPTQFDRFWNDLRQNTLAMAALWLLCTLCFVTLFAPWLAPYDPQLPTTEALLTPSWNNTGKVQFFLGTDDLNRDMLSRLIAGTRFTFGNALLVTFGAGAIGFLIAILSGLNFRFISNVIDTLLRTALAIPSLLLALIIIALLGPGESNMLLAIWLGLIPRFIRSISAAIAEEMSKEYVLSARLDGANRFFILYDSILPNILVTIVNSFSHAISIAILDIAALGFLGLGVQAPLPEWGTMLGESLELIFIAPWTVTLPGFAITLSVLCVNLLGDGICQALNAGID